MDPVHPEIRKIIDTVDQDLAARGLTDLHSAGVEPARAFLDSWVIPAADLPAHHKVEDRTIPGPGGPIPVRVYHPSDEDDLPVLVWFHGGGWVLGSLDLAELHCRQLSRDAGCVVVSVDYRLAPESVFPAAIDDCLAVTTWLGDQGGELGIDTTRIGVGGDSAGGNLAACVALGARDHDQSLVFQLLIYPVIDADFERPSYEQCAGGFLLTRAAMQFYWDCYVPDEAQRSDPRVAPIHATDLSDLPPALVITAQFDPLRDEAEAYAAALRDAGVAAITSRYDGMTHAFYNTITEQPVSAVQQASLEAATALRQAFGTTS